MPIVAKVRKSSIRDKKWTVELLVNNKVIRTIHFGQKGAEDFTLHKDPERKMRYLTRHIAREDWNNPTTAGFWSANLLWNKPTIKESMDDIERRFNIVFK